MIARQNQRAVVASSVASGVATATPLRPHSGARAARAAGVKSTVATDRELARVEEEKSSLRKRLQNVNRQQKERGRRVQRKAAIALGAAAIGRYELKEKLSVGPLDGLKVVALAGLVAPEALDLDDEMADIVDAVGDAALAISAYELGVDSATEAAEEEGTGGT